MSASQAQRVIAYIDGFNLYFGLRDAGLRRFYWLNLQALVGHLLKPDQCLVETNYFTARISGPRPGNRSKAARQLEERRKRQSRYLEALATLPAFHTHFGHYLAKPRTCKVCGANWQDHGKR